MALPSYNCNFMTTLTPEQKEAQMASMKSFDEEMPLVGIFWYDPQEHEFFGVYKKELTPKMIEEAADKILSIILNCIVIYGKSSISVLWHRINPLVSREIIR